MPSTRRKILRLRRLPALDEDLGAVDFGIAVHQAMARFLAALGSRWPGREAAAAAWAKAAEAAIAAIGPRAALWPPSGGHGSSASAPW